MPMSKASTWRPGTDFTAYKLPPLQQKIRENNESFKFGRAPKNCVVTGGTGFVGQRLVESLVEKGAERVVVFDIVPPARNMLQNSVVEYVVGDLCDADAVADAIRGADCVWHNGAAVGPFHPNELYHRVNVEGTRNVIQACRIHGVGKLIYSSSPSTRFNGRDFDGDTVEQMPKLPLEHYVAEYAKTKAEGELLVREACCNDLLTVAVAPHQVYGPRDNLFMPNLLEAAGGSLRIFGDGKNRICFTHVDNYVHALILAERALYQGSKALGKFYIATDAHTHPYKEGYCIFWEEIDKAVTAMGFTPLKAKFHLPVSLMMCLGLLCELVGGLFGVKTKLSRFSVRLVTMHRWFKTDVIKEDLGYTPIVAFEEGWAEAITWFKENWLPTFQLSRTGLATAVANQTQAKIDIQAGGSVDVRKRD